MHSCCGPGGLQNPRVLLVTSMRCNCIDDCPDRRLPVRWPSGRKPSGRSKTRTHFFRCQASYSLTTPKNTTVPARRHSNEQSLVNNPGVCSICPEAGIRNVGTWGPQLTKAAGLQDLLIRLTQCPGRLLKLESAVWTTALHACCSASPSPPSACAALILENLDVRDDKESCRLGLFLVSERCSICGQPEYEACKPAAKCTYQHKSMLTSGS